MPSTRSIANTVLTLGALEVPIAVHSVQEAKDVSLKMCTSEGKPVKQMYVCEETGEKFTQSELSKGVEVGDKIKVLDADELQAIKEAAEIEGVVIDHTIPLKDVPVYRTKGTYVLTTQPGAVGARSLRSIRDSLKKAKLAAVGKLNLKGRQYPYVLTVEGKNLILTTLRFADSYRSVDEYSESMDEVTKDATMRQAVEMTTAIFDALKTDAAVLDDYEDDAIVEKRALVEKVIAGKTVKPKKKSEAKSAEPDDLMDQLAEMADKAKRGEKVLA